MIKYEVILGDCPYLENGEYNFMFDDKEKFTAFVAEIMRNGYEVTIRSHQIDED